MCELEHEIPGEAVEPLEVFHDEAEGCFVFSVQDKINQESFKALLAKR